MKNINLKTSLYLVVGISIALFFLFAFLQNISVFNIENVIKIVSKVVSTDVIILGLFFKYLWKCRLFKGWLVPFPNLNGTWKGFIHTTWVDPITNERPSPIPAIVTIHQTFLNISCAMRTGEMSSISIVSDFYLDKENQITKLYYSYDSNPLQTVRERSPQHCGTMAFNIIEVPNLKLSGEYWTGRKTTGEIAMEFWKKEKLNYYPEEVGRHPVSDERNGKS